MKAVETARVPGAARLSVAVGLGASISHPLSPFDAQGHGRQAAAMRAYDVDACEEVALEHHVLLAHDAGFIERCSRVIAQKSALDHEQLVDASREPVDQLRRVLDDRFGKGGVVKPCSCESVPSTMTRKGFSPMFSRHDAYNTARSMHVPMCWVKTSPAKRMRCPAPKLDGGSEYTMPCSLIARYTAPAILRTRSGSPD